ncbi:MAG: hypothetical protein ACOYT7_03690 [Patescibacteria group bacterium]
MRSFAKHLPHYLALFGILLVGGLSFALFSYDRVFQVAIAVATAVSYVVWGLVHHMLHKDLHLSVFIEYLLVASLGLIIIFSLIFRA